MNMANDLQKGNLWKRISAGIFDWILTGILAVGIACLLSWLLGYDDYSQSLDQTYAKYEAEYGVTFEISEEQYQSMTDQQRLNYDAARDALIRDPEAIRSYNMVRHLPMVITTLGILLALVALEFVVPLLLGEGRTLGKKIFGLCLVRTDGVRMNHMQLFVRTILGKFTIETMIPVYILLMLFWGIADLSGTVLLIGLLIAQCVIMAVTRTNSLLHDLLAGTAVVDFASQTIFRTTQDLIDYQKRIAADRAARQTY